jgi:PAS domain S-box-containing protein
MDQAFKLYNNGEVITPEVLQAIFDILPAGIEMLIPVRDKNNKIVDFEYILENESIRKTPGYLRRVGKKFLIENGGCKELVEKMAGIIESGQPSRGESSGELTNSAQCFDVKYIKYGDGIIIFRENITKKKLAEGSLREDAHFIDQIVETSPDIIYIMDLNTLQVIYTNRQIAVELGYTKPQIDQMKNPLIDIMYEEDMPPFIEHLQKIKTSGSDHKVMEIEYRLKDAKGNIRWFCDRNTVFKRNSHNSPVEKLGFSQDTTIRKEQEEQLRTDIDILSQAEEITRMGTWEYDIDTGKFKWSDGMYRLFNLSRREPLSPEIYFEYTPEEEKEAVTRIVDNIMHDYDAFDETITLLPSGQEKKIVRIRAVPVKDKGKNLVKMVGVDLDITSQVRSSEEINELNKILTIKNRDLQELNTELKTFNTVTPVISKTPSSFYIRTLNISPETKPVI